MGTLLLFPLVFSTSMLSGALGMAGGMILMGGLLAYYGPTEALLIHGILQFFSNFQRYCQLRAHVQVRLVAYYALGALISYFVLREIDFRPSRRSVYSFMAFSAFLGALQFRTPFSVKSYRVAFTGGFVVNACQIVGGVGGPVLDFFFQDKRLSRFELVGTKALASAVGHTFKVFFMAELLSGPEITTLISPLFLVALLGVSFWGTRISRNVLERLSHENFFRISAGLLATIGFIYLWQAWRI